jgi:dihydroorotase
VVGLETCLGLVNAKLVEPGVLTLEDAVSKLTAVPASIMQMERWGYSAGLEEGSDANLVVFNPEFEWKVEPGEFQSRSRNTPFGGWDLKGKVVHTVLRGKPVVRDSRPVEVGEC